MFVYVVVVVVSLPGGAYGDATPRGAEAERGEGQKRRARQDQTSGLLHRQGSASLLEQRGEGDLEAPPTHLDER